MLYTCVEGYHLIDDCSTDIITNTSWEDPSVAVFAEWEAVGALLIIVLSSSASHRSLFLAVKSTAINDEDGECIVEEIEVPPGLRETHTLLWTRIAAVGFMHVSPTSIQLLRRGEAGLTILATLTAAEVFPEGGAAICQAASASDASVFVSCRGAFARVDVSGAALRVGFIKHMSGEIMSLSATPCSSSDIERGHAVDMHLVCLGYWDATACSVYCISRDAVEPVDITGASTTSAAEQSTCIASCFVSVLTEKAEMLVCVSAHGHSLYTSRMTQPPSHMTSNARPLQASQEKLCTFSSAIARVVAVRDSASFLAQTGTHTELFTWSVEPSAWVRRVLLLDGTGLLLCPCAAYLRPGDPEGDRIGIVRLQCGTTAPRLVLSSLAPMRRVHPVYRYVHAGAMKVWPL